MSQQWQRFLDANGVGSVVSATVTKVVPFGAFVEVEPGAHGLLHRDEWAGEPAEGQTLSVRVLDIDRQRERFSVAPA